MVLYDGDGRGADGAGAAGESPGLIRQTADEQFLVRLQQLKEKNLSAAEAAAREQNSRRIQDEFAADFVALSWSLLRISEAQLGSDFSDADLKKLASLIYERCRSRMLGQKAFAFLVPIGWVFGPILYTDGELHSWRYRKRYEALRKAYGEEFFPYDRLKNFLDLNR